MRPDEKTMKPISLLRDTYVLSTLGLPFIIVALCVHCGMIIRIKTTLASYDLPFKLEVLDAFFPSHIS